MSEIEEVRKKLGEIIRSTCNKIGCGKCGLEYNDESGKKTCPHDILYVKLLELEQGGKANE